MNAIKRLMEIADEFEGAPSGRFPRKSEFEWVEWCHSTSKDIRSAAEALRCIAVQIDSVAKTDVGVLWQHRETGRKAVEFTDEPRSVSAVEGWYPVGRLHLVPFPEKSR